MAETSVLNVLLANAILHGWFSAVTPCFRRYYGHEFIYSRLERAKRTLGLDVFFTDPGSPWQRGTVENTIGLIRQFLPKKTDLSGIKKAQIRAIEKILNGRPRKILNYYTPAEILTSKPGKKPRIKTFLFS